MELDVSALSPSVEGKLYEFSRRVWKREYWKRLVLIGADAYSLLKCVRALKRNRVLCILQEVPAGKISNEESYLDFICELDNKVNLKLSEYTASLLGFNVFAGAGAVELSFRMKVPLLFAVIRRIGKLNYILNLEEVCFTDDGSIEGSLNVLYKKIEREICKFPASWGLWPWLHKIVASL